MSSNNKPREYDAILGGNCLPIDAVVLGGIEGIKRRLVNVNDWLDKPRRLIEYDVNAQSLLSILMRYFYNHSSPRPGELKMRLRYDRRIIYLSALKDASYPETVKIYSPQYCGYLYHHGLLWGDRCGVHQEKPKQWLDKALLTLALQASEGYIIHEPIDTPGAENFFFLIVYGTYNEPTRTIITSASTWKSACYLEAVHLYSTLHDEKYRYKLLNCFQWIEASWVKVGDNDVFPLPIINVFDKLIKNK